MVLHEDRDIPVWYQARGIERYIPCSEKLREVSSVGTGIQTGNSKYNLLSLQSLEQQLGIRPAQDMGPSP